MVDLCNPLSILVEIADYLTMGTMWLSAPVGLLQVFIAEEGPAKGSRLYHGRILTLIEHLSYTSRGDEDDLIR